MRKDERAAIARLIEVFGAEVMISVPEYVPAEPRTRGAARVAVTEQVTACTRCDLRAGCNAPVVPRFPVMGLLAPSRVTVVCESPTSDEDRTGLAGSGRVGRVLRSGLAQAGIDPGDCTFTYVTACRAQREGLQHPPSVFQQAACRENLLAAVEAADAQYALLLGAVAVRAWRDDVKVSQVAGRLFTWGNRYVYPMWSVQAVLREAFNAHEWRAQLSQFGQIVADDAGVSALHQRCLECQEPVYGYDSEGVPWCRKHLPEHVSKAATQHQRWNRQHVNQLTFGEASE